MNFLRTRPVYTTGLGLVIIGIIFWVLLGLWLPTQSPSWASSGAACITIGRWLFGLGIVIIIINFLIGLFGSTEA